MRVQRMAPTERDEREIHDDQQDALRDLEPAPMGGRRPEPGDDAAAERESVQSPEPCRQAQPASRSVNPVELLRALDHLEDRVADLWPNRPDFIFKAHNIARDAFYLRLRLEDK